MINKINILREKLYNEIENKSLYADEVVKISQELDLLILRYYKDDDINNTKLIDFQIMRKNVE